MVKNKHNNKIDSEQNVKINLSTKLVYFMFYIMLGFIPHFYKYIEYKVASSETMYFKKVAYADLYILGKSRLFLLFTVLIVLIFIYELLTDYRKFIFDKVTIATLCFGAVVVISSVFSKYQDLVYFGAKDRFEGMWVWLAYLTVFIVIRHYLADKRFTRNLSKVFVFSASLMAAIGIAQVFGYDIYTDGIFKKFCFPSVMAQNLDKYLTAKSTDIFAVGAMYNSNYYGVYVALASIFSLHCLFTTTKKTKYAYILTFILSYGAVIASKAEVGLLVFFVGVLLCLVYNFRNIFHNKVALSLLVVSSVAVDRFMAVHVKFGQSANAYLIYKVLLVITIIVLAVCYGLTKSEFLRKYLAKYSMILSIVVVGAVAVVVNLSLPYLNHQDKNTLLKDVTFNENQVVFDYVDGRDFSIKVSNDDVKVFDDKSKELELHKEQDNMLTFNYANVTYKMLAQKYSNGLLVSLKNPLMINAFYDGNTFKYLSPYRGCVDVEKPRRVGYYYQNGGALTMRSYIWSVYLAKIKESLLLGKGLETYLLEFPQDDYVGKFNFYKSSYSLLVDKPHSFYIGILFSVGGIAVILLIAFVVLVVNKYIKAAVKSLGAESVDNNDRYIYLIAALAILISGITNDSIVPMTMMLAIFAGLGASCES